MLRLILLAGLLATPIVPDATAILRDVDALRAPDEANLLQRIAIQSRSARGPSPTVRYEIRTRRGTGSLVLAIDGDGRGQKYLSTSAGYWFYAPRTRQAIRLTPSQLLRGQASVGDISRVQFASDYNAVVRTEDTKTQILDLTARSKLATYAKIALTVERGTNRPLAADLYAAAGRKLKSMSFGPVVTVSGRRLVGTTTYIDGIDPSRSTIVTVEAVAGTPTPALLFRPQALGLDR